MDPCHFFRSCSVYEAEAYARGVCRRSREGWKQARLIAYASLRPWCKNLKMADVAKFYWEEEIGYAGQDDENDVVTDEEEVDAMVRSRLENLIKAMEEDGKREHSSEAAAGR